MSCAFYFQENGMMEVVPEGNMESAINLSTATGKEKEVVSAVLLGNQSPKLTNGEAGEIENGTLNAEQLMQQVRTMSRPHEGHTGSGRSFMLVFSLCFEMFIYIHSLHRSKCIIYFYIKYLLLSISVKDAYFILQ